MTVQFIFREGFVRTARTLIRGRLLVAGDVLTEDEFGVRFVRTTRTLILGRFLVSEEVLSANTFATEYFSANVTIEGRFLFVVAFFIQD